MFDIAKQDKVFLCTNSINFTNSPMQTVTVRDFRRIRTRNKETTKLKQECIPVGCVPSAAVAVSPATHTPCYACPSATPPPMPHMRPCHAHPLPHTPAMHVPPAMRALPVNRITDKCKNITFPQLLLRTVTSRNLPASAFLPCLSPAFG